MSPADLKIRFASCKLKKYAIRFIGPNQGKKGTRTMSEINEVYKYLHSRTFFVATDDEGQPRVRPFGALDVYEGKLYIQTGNVKNVYKQMVTNPRIEICAMGDNGTWIRITANAVCDDRIKVRQHMLDTNPNLKNMYSADDGNCEVLYLANVKATFYSFSSEPRTVTF